jgi:phage FluMu protein Com
MKVKACLRDIYFNVQCPKCKNDFDWKPNLGRLAYYPAQRPLWCDNCGWFLPKTENQLLNAWLDSLHG